MILSTTSERETRRDMCVSRDRKLIAIKWTKPSITWRRREDVNTDPIEDTLVAVSAFPTYSMYVRVHVSQFVTWYIRVVSHFVTSFGRVLSQSRVTRNPAISWSFETT